MRALVMYDSKFGNTERVAGTIADAIGERASVRLIAAGDGPLDVEGVDLLIVGGPTHAHSLSAAMRSFLDTIPRDALTGIESAAFDTRYQLPRFMVGGAAIPIARRLQRKGARLVASPESFFVAKSEGPLLDGEVERATAWGASLLERTAAVAGDPVRVAG